MKKLPILAILMGLVMVMSVLAGPPTPTPVKLVVTVNGQGVDYDYTKVTNTYTGEVLTASERDSLKIVNGVGFFDLSQFKVNPDPFIPMPFALSRNVIKIQACDVHPDCKTSFVVDDFSPRTVRITIVDDTIPIEKIVKQIECYDGSVVFNQEDCPTPPPPVVKYVCEDGTEVAEASECVPPEEEKDIYDYLFQLALVILGALGLWGFISGLVPYWYNKGVELVKKGKRLGDKDMIAKGESHKRRALKMMITSVKRAKEGKYKK